MSIKFIQKFQMHETEKTLKQHTMAKGVSYIMLHILFFYVLT
jgi:hypothetical protein